MFNRLKPLMAREHGTARLEVMIPGDPNRYRLEPGGELTVVGRRIDQRDATGRPLAFAAEERAGVIAMAEALGLNPGDYTVTEDMASRSDMTTRRVTGLTPQMELAALKGALLTFDFVLRGDRRRFTRSPRLAPLMQQIHDSVMHGPIAHDILTRVVHGIAYEELDDILRLRTTYGPARTEFEHVLIAAADPTAGTLDLVWLVADVDPFTFRLSRTWSEEPFTLMVGCGVLHEEEAFGPIEIPEPFSLGPRGLRRTHFILPATGAMMRPTMEAAFREISEHRLAALQRAQNLVEHRCDGLVRSGIAIFTRLPEPGDAGGNSVAAGLERRLRRLFADRLAHAGGEQVFTAALHARLDAMDPAVRTETIASADVAAAHVSWAAWIDTHRAILHDLEQPLGMPGRFVSLSTTIEEAT